MDVKEGHLLLGDPTFEKMENGRVRCSETGHEMLPGDVVAYKTSKRCRLALINVALSQKKPPLNLFKQDPLSKSKLICKMTGDTINKSEEHIWKHINGKKFLNKLEQEEEKLSARQDDKANSGDLHLEESSAKEVKKKIDGSNSKKMKKKIALRNAHVINSCDVENADTDAQDFWEPPIGNRWDFDDGRDRWASCSSSEDGTDNEDETEQVSGEELAETAELVADEHAETVDLVSRTKRMSVAIGPSSDASRKKKSKVELESPN